MFYIAYITFEIPSIVCCKYFGPGKWIPFISFGFGLLSLCTAFVHNFGQAAGVRFLLGVFEAGMLPGIAYYLSRWYRKSELAFRLSLYLTTAPLAGARHISVLFEDRQLTEAYNRRVWRIACECHLEDR